MGDVDYVQSSSSSGNFEAKAVWGGTASLLECIIRGVIHCSIAWINFLASIYRNH
jgi:hypothetical protein